MDARALLLGSPTLHHGMLYRVAGLLQYLSGIKPKNKIGGVHTLAVEVLEQGDGHVFQHPCDAFQTVPRIDIAFYAALERAFAAARKDTGNGACDGRWRILQGWQWDPMKRSDLEPLTAPSGASAGAAAALAWSCAFAGKVTDDRIVVIADINTAGQVGPVDDAAIPAKIAAVRNAPAFGWNRFDTVVVAAENFRTARQASEQYLGALKVVEIAFGGDSTVDTNPDNSD